MVDNKAIIHLLSIHYNMLHRYTLYATGLLLALTLNSCFFFMNPNSRNSNSQASSSAYEPIYMNRSQLNVSVQSQSPTTLSKPGKIYARPPYLFINERYAGIHVIDNTNPSAPVKRSFIRIPGNIDIAVKGNMLYADNAVDLVTIDISNPLQPRLANRQQSIFPNQATSPDGYLFYPSDNTQFIVGWRKR